MSIATLKKKSAAKYNNNSAGAPLFSLNGTHRNQGYVGQTSLSRFTSRTLVRNGGLRNHGGCCGTFDIGQPVFSGITTTEDSNVVKNSVLNNDGMINTKYRWIRRPQPYAVVKNDSNHNVNSQYNQIIIVRNNAIDEAASCYAVPECPTGLSGCNNSVTYTKPASSYTGAGETPLYKGVALSQNEYTLLKRVKCAVYDRIDISGNTISGKPFACGS
jgi:hypothetical protein